jgi:hypothetical protein
MARYILVLGVLFSACNDDLSGQDITPIQTDRPDQTECPFIVPKDHFQMETGFLYEQTDKNTQSVSAPSILFKYGLNERLELRLITEFTTIKSGESTVSGLNPLTIGFKINIAQEKGIYQLLLLSVILQFRASLQRISHQHILRLPSALQCSIPYQKNFLSGIISAQNGKVKQQSRHSYIL